VHEQPKEINDKVAQNNDNHRIQAGNHGILLMLVVSFNSCMLVVPSLMKLNDDIYVIDLLIDFSINSTFNINCLVDYKGLINIIPLADKAYPEPIFESPFFSPLPYILPYISC